MLTTELGERSERASIGAAGDAAQYETAGASRTRAETAVQKYVDGERVERARFERAMPPLAIRGRTRGADVRTAKRCREPHRSLASRVGTFP
jgi:hypothetical protein